MGAEDDAARAGGIDRFWDDLVRGQVREGNEPSRADAAVIRSLHRSAGRPEPDPDFTRRLRADLMRETAVPLLPSNAVHPGLNGAGERVNEVLGFPQRDFSRNGRWGPLLATAALLVLALFGGLVAVFGQLSIPGRDEPPGSIPASELGWEIETLIFARVSEWPAPDPLLWASLRRETFAPGASEEFGIAGSTGDGVDLFTVETGQITVDADGPMVHWRAADGSNAEPDTLRGESTVVLEQGDWLFVPAGTSYRRSNNSPAPIVVLGLQVTQKKVTHFPDGVTYERIMPYQVLSDPWPAPADVRLSQITLQAEAGISLLDLPGLQMLYVEDGSLDLMGARNLGDFAPISWKTIPAGQSMAHFDATTALANRSRNPITVLIVTVEPAS